MYIYTEIFFSKYTFNKKWKEKKVYLFIDVYNLIGQQYTKLLWRNC